MYYLKLKFPTMKTFLTEAEQAGELEKVYDLVMSFYHVKPKFH